MKKRNQTTAQLKGDLMHDSVSQHQASSYDGWLYDQVQIGLESSRSGKSVAAEKVEAEFKARREVTKRKLADRA